MSTRLIGMIWVFVFVASGFCQPLEIYYQDLSGMISNSPQRQLAHFQRLTEAEDIRHQLRWSNPNIGMEREHVTGNGFDETESAIVLSKSFMLPWATLAQRGAMHAGLQANYWAMVNDSLVLLQEIRYRYLDLLLLKNHRAELEKIRIQFIKALNIANEQYEQGMTSAIQNRLLQMARSQIRFKELQLDRAFANQRQELSLLLGLDPELAWQLATVFAFDSLHTNSVIHQTANLLQHPSLQSLDQRTIVSEKLISLQKSGIFSSIELEGGYKMVNDDVSGYVAGISIPLPLLNQNRAMVRKQQAEFNALRTEQVIKQREMTARLRWLLNTIKLQQKYLFEMQYTTGNAEIVNDLMFAFYQGSSPLGDVLAGVQTCLDGLATLFEQYSAYYKNVLELEYLMQQDLLQFEGGQE